MHIALETALNPRAQVLVVSPRADQQKIFREDRLLRLYRDSPALRHLVGERFGARLSAGHILLSNGARISFRSAFHNADSARGISADFLVIDEVQDVAPGSVAVLEGRAT